MSNDRQNELQCSQFEALLAELLEAEVAESTDAQDPARAGAGTMVSEGPRAQREAFDAHRESCAICGPLFAQAREGMLLLRSLQEVDPPKNLIHNILAATSLADAPAQAVDKRAELVKPGLRQRWQKLLQPAPILGSLLHSRFAMSFCMAFFSLSLTLSLSGVKITDVYKMVSHPSTLGRSVVLQYTQVETRVMHYYDNMRIVYEVQNRVQQLRKAATPQNNTPKPDQQNQNRPVPGEKQRDQQDYSLERDGSLIANATLKHEGAQL